MLPENPMFQITVKNNKKYFLDLIQRAKIEKDVYFSKHFFERMVERNLEVHKFNLFRMMIAAFKDFRSNTYNKLTYKVVFKELVMVCEIDIGPVSQKRRFSVVTCFEHDKVDQFDVYIDLAKQV